MQILRILILGPHIRVLGLKNCFYQLLLDQLPVLLKNNDLIGQILKMPRQPKDFEPLVLELPKQYSKMYQIRTY